MNVEENTKQPLDKSDMRELLSTSAGPRGPYVTGIPSQRRSQRSTEDQEALMKAADEKRARRRAKALLNSNR